MDSENLKQLSALTALNSMMKKGHFDICCIRDVAQLLGVDPKGDAYTLLHPLHCIDFAEMPRELREAIPRLIQECLGVAPTFQFVPGDLTLRRTVRIVDVEPDPAPPRRGLFSLFSGGK